MASDTFGQFVLILVWVEASVGVAMEGNRYAGDECGMGPECGIACSRGCVDGGVGGRGIDLGGCGVCGG